MKYKERREGDNQTHATRHPKGINRGYYMAARGYEFYLRVLKVSLTRSLRSLVRDTFSTNGHVMFCLFYRY